MTEKKYITGADVLRALADGKKVRRAPWSKGRFLQLTSEGVANSDGHPSFIMEANDWEIVEEPTTDAELVAEMRRLARTGATYEMAPAYAHCADMLEARSLTGSKP